MDPKDPSIAKRFPGVQAAAASFKLPITPVEVQSESEFELAVAKVRKRTERRIDTHGKQQIL
jgi:hypothetical protein